MVMHQCHEDEGIRRVTIRVMQWEGFDQPLLMLKMRKAMSKEMQAASRNWEKIQWIPRALRKGDSHADTFILA